MDSKIAKMHESRQPVDLKRKDNLYGLRKIYLALRTYPHANLDDEFVNTLEVKIASPIGEAEPQFFVLFNRDTFDELWARSELWAKSDPEFECEWPTFYLNTNYAAAYHLSDFLSSCASRYLDGGGTLCDHGPWEWRTVDSTQLENSLGCARGGEHDCATACVFDNANPAYPHLGCMVIEGAALDDRLLWSEVLSAVGFMLRRLLKKEYKMHQLVPVFVVTIAGKKARILQAHFDTHLVIQKSNIIDLSKQNFEGIKYLLRWMMCTPVGQTLSDTPAKAFKSPRK